MRAVQLTGYGSPDVVEVVDVAEPHAGPGQVRIAVRVSGLSTGEVRLRSGAVRDLVPARFPWRTGMEAAGVVDEVGDGVGGVRPGDEVFGLVDLAARGANADLAVLTAWAPRPTAWTWEEAGGAAGSVETATRVLDRLAVRRGPTVLVHGSSGAAGTVLAQIAIARGATVVGTASQANHDLVRSLGAVPTTYGPGLVDRVRALAPSGVDAAVDCAGRDVPDLVTIAGGSSAVVTIADLGAAAHGVPLSFPRPEQDAPGADPFAVHGLAQAVSLADAGRLRVPVAATFPLEDAAAAHEFADAGTHRGGSCS